MIFHYFIFLFAHPIHVHNKIGVDLVVGIQIIYFRLVPLHHYTKEKRSDNGLMLQENNNMNKNNKNNDLYKLFFHSAMGFFSASAFSVCPSAS